MIKVGIIGYGNMGRAIAERIKNNYAVCIFDKIKCIVSDKLTLARSLSELVQQSELIILAVKPQDFDLLLNEIKPFVNDKLIISIAAGMTTGYLKNQLGLKTRLIRIMPNLPAQIGEGVSVLFSGENVDKEELNLDGHLAYDVFSNLGLVLVVDNEKMINAATAISGSGPAFFCHFVIQKNGQADKLRDEFMISLTQAAVNLGFNQRQADILAKKTVDGSIAMLTQKHLLPKELIGMVASKGGTTEAGLEVLASGGSLIAATQKALERASQLEKNLPLVRRKD